MIVPMKHVDVLCVAPLGEQMLERLRSLGAVHLDLSSAQGADVAAARGECEAAEKAVRRILKARAGRETASRAAVPVADVLSLAAARETLKDDLAACEKDIRRYSVFGDFDPALARSLAEKGVSLALRGDGSFSLGYGDGAAEAGDVALPRVRLSEMIRARADLEARLAETTGRLAACDEKAILAAFPALADRIAFACAKETLQASGAVQIVSGWIPEPQTARFADEARAAGWGYLLRDPEADETPPSLVEPPRLFRPMKALFDGLGIAPAYTESDVSVPFMCYFSLFFAMLVGDGAYGLIFLGATLALRKKLATSWFVLLSVFSSATVLWGVLSNTWFGMALPCCRNWPTAAWLSDPSYHNIMLLCFTIGASHLILARLWNGLCRLNDRTCLSEFGWAGILLFMYLVTNSIVGIFDAIPVWGYWVFGVSLVLVFGFTLKPSEFKTRGAELGMLPLNIMSALGDIISYVRLFAVGLASVKVAENFNTMAFGLVSGEGAFWLKALLSVGTLAILVVGHGLNLAMAGLSVLVHAVRLNTLEFSNHKGVSWAGFAYRPFRKRGA
jgi:V/A-type H+-transporting ATPase subunit I